MTPERRPPLVVLDAAGGEELDAAAERLRSAGWRITDDLRNPPLDLTRTVVRGIVDGPDAAEAAVLVAAWGGGVLLGFGTLDAEVRHRLLDDLDRIGEVERWSVSVAPDGGNGTDDGEGIRLLDLLAAGRTLGQAARELHLSRRTADRRLAAARAALGADSTTAAIAALARMRARRRS